ncbi:MAG: sigma-70 family RNA polymerase sigma factor [Clostridia bacterium]|nr:sigma-70 family RNA polymerase sigma factor [Clostridia bacterium]
MVSYGTNESIERLVETYSGMLLRLARSRLNNTMDAEDAVQEVFLYLIEHKVTFKNAEHEKAWLIRATLHRAADIGKRASKASLPLDDACVGAQDENKSFVADALCSLPEKYAAVLYLYYYEGYSIKEIGTVLKIPSATAGTRLSRGRTLLKKLLKEDL